MDAYFSNFSKPVGYISREYYATIQLPEEHLQYKSSINQYWKLMVKVDGEANLQGLQRPLEVLGNLHRIPSIHSLAIATCVCWYLFQIRAFPSVGDQSMNMSCQQSLLCILKLSGRDDTNHGQTNISQSLKGMEDCWKIHFLKMYLLLKMGIFQLDMLVFYQCDRIYKRLLYGIQSYCQNMTDCQFTSNTTWYSLQVIVTSPSSANEPGYVGVWNNLSLKQKHSTSKQNRRIWMNLFMYANAWFPEENGPFRVSENPYIPPNRCLSAELNEINSRHSLGVRFISIGKFGKWVGSQGTLIVLPSRKLTFPTWRKGKSSSKWTF